jgi:5-methylcytosine-specific restriction enzyme subunit McrC
MRKIYEALGKEQGEVIDCLIIHPDQENGLDNLANVNLKAIEIERYYDVYKIGIKLPYIK